MQSSKQIKKNRLWKHWLHWLPSTVFGSDLKRIHNYDPEQFRSTFENFQSHGRKKLSDEEYEGIQPLIQAQKCKEITLTSLAEESMEWWAKGWGWIHPWKHTLNGNVDRLTKVALLRTMKAINEDPLNFFMRHTGISEEQKQRYLSIRIATLDSRSNMQYIHNMNS